ncbi:MAG TPA: cyclic nucleotide-binding domain-containing protein [bacterium]|nr:cyclic nucleotide-binding domain-containing protein [bacterium]
MAEKVDLRKVKDQAARALKKGEWDKALEKYEVLVKAQPKDLRQKMKQGDILVKLKRVDDAFRTYGDVAEAYSKGGFLIQAVSVYKLMQQLDPVRPEIAEKLEQLNRARGRAPAAPQPEAAPPDAEPGLEAVMPAAPAEEGKSLKDEIEEAKHREKARAKDKGADWRFPETPLFGKLGEEEFTQVVSKFQVGTIPKGTMVIKEGTKGDAFFIVSQGDVRVFRTHPKSDKKITLAHLKDGAFFGEMAFFLDSVRSASCETAAETVLLRISRKDLEQLMREYPNIRSVMYDFFKKRALDQLFKTMGLFASLEDAERLVLAEKFDMVAAEPGTQLIQEGEEGQYLWVIFSGEAEVTTQHEDKGPVKLATLGPGEYCGEISLIQSKLNTADVVTSSRCVLFRLGRPVFMELLAIHSPMLEELSSVIEQRLKSTVDALLRA